MHVSKALLSDTNTTDFTDKRMKQYFATHNVKPVVPLLTVLVRMEPPRGKKHAIHRLRKCFILLGKRLRELAPAAGTRKHATLALNILGFTVHRTRLGAFVIKSCEKVLLFWCARQPRQADRVDLRNVLQISDQPFTMN